MRPYIAIARIDHWFKNVFVIPGIVFALFADPKLMGPNLIKPVLLAFVSVCLVASGNYVINELLDGERDKLHPVKKARPVASGLVKKPIAIAEWAAFLAAGIGVGLLVNKGTGFVAISLAVMGVIYNVPPIRSKEKPYLDVLSESVNNPIRFLYGWFATGTLLIAPASVLLAYWMLGAFFMAIKRVAEYRHIGDPQRAAEYRGSFAWYNEQRLVISTMFYATAFGMFSGIFVVRYHIELCLTVPLVAGFMAAYLNLGFLPNSPTQYPEHLYKQKAFMAYTVFTFLAVTTTLLTDMPMVHKFFAPTIAAAPVEAPPR